MSDRLEALIALSWSIDFSMYGYTHKHTHIYIININVQVHIYAYIFKYVNTYICLADVTTSFNSSSNGEKRMYHF